jgi:hypothetical protein
VDDHEAARSRARRLASDAVRRRAYVRLLARPDLDHDEAASQQQDVARITAAGQTTLVSLKYSVPPPQTGSWSSLTLPASTSLRTALR